MRYDVFVCHQEAGTNPLCEKLQLKDLLPFEISRLAKYPLLIDRLIKYTQRKLCFRTDPLMN